MLIVNQGKELEMNDPARLNNSFPHRTAPHSWHSIAAIYMTQYSSIHKGGITSPLCCLLVALFFLLFVPILLSLSPCFFMHPLLFIDFRTGYHFFLSIPSFFPPYTPHPSQSNNFFHQTILLTSHFHIKDSLLGCPSTFTYIF